MMATVKAAVVVVVRRQQKKRAAATALIAVTHQQPANKLRPVKCQKGPNICFVDFLPDSVYSFPFCMHINR